MLGKLPQYLKFKLLNSAECKMELGKCIAVVASHNWDKHIRPTNTKLKIISHGRQIWLKILYEHKVLFRQLIFGLIFLFKEK